MLFDILANHIHDLDLRILGPDVREKLFDLVEESVKVRLQASLSEFRSLLLRCYVMGGILHSRLSREHRRLDKRVNAGIREIVAPDNTVLPALERRKRGSVVKQCPEKRELSVFRGQFTCLLLHKTI